MIFGGIIGKIAMGVAAALFVVAGLLKFENDQLHAKLNAARAELATCGARLQNILEDQASDEAIDNIDLNDWVLPDHWLRPTNPDD